MRLASVNHIELSAKQFLHTPLQSKEEGSEYFYSAAPPPSLFKLGNSYNVLRLKECQLPFS